MRSTRDAAGGEGSSSSAMDLSVVLVGCGKMGGALLSGWLARGLAPGRVRVVEADPGARARLAAESAAVTAVASAAELPADTVADVLVLAVKPQSMAALVPDYRRFAAPAGGTRTAFLSIAAGKPIAFFETHLGREAPIIRAMPNTPAAVGRGITALYGNGNVGDADRARCTALLEAVGEVAWLADEGLMDAVTAVSGSGPAYVFLLAEALARAGEAAGLPADLAGRLARATVAGAGELLYQAAESPAVLRANVTSPGGTTAAALSVLMADDGVGPLLTRAVAAATRRSRELAG